MSEIIIDEQGTSIFGDPQSRLAEIEQIMKPKLTEIRNKIEINNRREFPQKLNFLPVITNLLDANLRKKPLVRYDYATSVSANELQGFASAFFDLLLFIREYVPEYIANKQTFCAFASISVSAFNNLQNSTDGDIVAITENLIDSFIETNISGAMGGSVNSTATFNRMRAKDVGHGVTLKAEEQPVANNTVVVMDNDTVKKQLANMFGGKFLGKGK